MHIVSKRQNKSPARIGALSVLPVFFNLQGKRAIIVGGTDAAAWKAELLCAAGAIVEVFALANDISDEMCQLIVGNSETGCIRHIDVHWRDADFSGAAMIVGDIPADHAVEFVARVHGSGVPVNVIDQPEFCDFQFGSIVNRSPVVIGISTSGAAPILGQAVRQRIEMVLPKTLGAWGALAQKIRAKVMQTLPIGAPRRAFWERFVERAFSSAPMDMAAGDLKIDGDPQGRVTFVGAGPGEADLLTVKAVRALQSADVILFDEAVSADVLELARREAWRVLVGKSDYRHSCANDDVDETMLKLARSGEHIVRLKSGDLADNGHTSAQIEMLVQNCIQVAVVPGVSSNPEFIAAHGTIVGQRSGRHHQAVTKI